MQIDMGITVHLVFSPRSRLVQQCSFVLEAGATLADAVRKSGLLASLSDGQAAAQEWGVWGRKAAHNQVLHDGDRVELYRALLVDPKVARRERFVRQGAKTTGLFAKRRAGGAAGY